MTSCLILLLTLLVAVAIALATLLQRERRASRALREVVDSIPGGCVVWDAHDRLLTWNGGFEDVYTLVAPVLRRGITFEALIRYGVSRGQYPQAVDREDEFVAELVEAHRRGSQTAERQLPNGRWFLIHEERTLSGNLVGIRSDITARKAALARLAASRDVAHHMAHHDALTGLANRILFHERLDAALASHQAAGPRFAVLCLDLDGFKAVNDALGHAGGDELLAAVAGRLSAEVQGDATVARLGGDEFAVLLPGADMRKATNVARRVIACVGMPYQLMSGRSDVGVSVGIAVADEGGTRDEFMRRADRALYDAKAAGRGTFRPDGDAADEWTRDLTGIAEAA